jgi:hypothetical protein
MGWDPGITLSLSSAYADWNHPVTIRMPILRAPQQISKLANKSIIIKSTVRSSGLKDISRRKKMIPAMQSKITSA